MLLIKTSRVFLSNSYVFQAVHRCKFSITMSTSLSAYMFGEVFVDCVTLHPVTSCGYVLGVTGC